MRSKRPLLIVLGVVAVLAIAWLLRSRTHGPSEGSRPAAATQAPRAVPVTLATVAERDVSIYLEGLGSVVAYNTVAVKTQVDGRLDKVAFREGQSVRRGDLLAQIDPRPFQIQLQQGKGALARDEAQLAAARLNLRRYRELVAQHLVPQQQVDDQAAVVGQLEGAVDIDRAAIESARLNLDYARITSPIDGVTGIRLVDPGNVVHASDQTGIVVVTQLDPIAVVFTLPQDQLTPVFDELARGPLAVDLFSRGGSTKLGSGELALVDNQINQATSTIRLKAVAPNPRRVLWPNQFVNARLHLKTRRGAVVMPVTAVQHGPSGTFVYVVGDDMTAQARPVGVDLTQADMAVVASGLKPGERVVVEGQTALRPGSKVSAREAQRPASKVASDGAAAATTGGEGGRGGAPEKSSRPGAPPAEGKP